MERNNKNYFIDVDAIIKYCETNKQNNDVIQKEISDNYELYDEKDLRLSQKLVHEVITPNSFGVDETKYELMKILVSVVLSNDSGISTADFSISQKIAFNTLVNKEIIKEL